MRDAVGRLRRLNKNSRTRPRNAGHVVSFGAHQFCGVNIHTFSLLRWRRSCSSVFTFELAQQQKTRAPRNLGRGKCLTQMDLPLAASGPSHPTARAVACASRDIIRTPGRNNIFWPLCRPDQPGPGSQFAAPHYERKFTPFCEKLQSPFSFISCVLREVRKE